jgi:hypothetical protein
MSILPYGCNPERPNIISTAMNIADYYRTRARELRREAQDSSNAVVKQSKLETALAFERLVAVMRTRRSPKADGARAAADTVVHRR